MRLADPTAYNEEATTLSHTGCGQCCVASVLTDAGQQTTPDAVEAAIAGGSSGTTGNQLASYLGAQGIANVLDGTTPMSTYVPAALANGHEVIALYQCDGYALPRPAGSTGIAHWVVIYAWDEPAGYAWLMTPWGGINAQFSTSSLIAADLTTHIEINQRLPKDGEQEEEPMLLLDHGDGNFWLLSGSFYVNLGPKDGNATVNALIAIHVPTAPLSGDAHNSLVAQTTHAAGGGGTGTVTGSLTIS